MSQSYSEKIFSPSLHQIRFDKMEAINKEGCCSKYICGTFTGSGTEKLKARVFNGSDIRKCTWDENSVRHITVDDSNVWRSFVDVMKNLLGNNRSDDYKDRVDKYVEKLPRYCCQYKYQMHFL